MRFCVVRTQPAVNRALTAFARRLAADRRILVASVEFLGLDSLLAKARTGPARSGKAGVIFTEEFPR
jgi:hypothetical protein